MAFEIIKLTYLLTIIKCRRWVKVQLIHLMKYSYCLFLIDAIMTLLSNVWLAPHNLITWGYKVQLLQNRIHISPACFILWRMHTYSNLFHTRMLELCVKRLANSVPNRNHNPELISPAAVCVFKQWFCLVFLNAWFEGLNAPWTHLRSFIVVTRVLKSPEIYLVNFQALQKFWPLFLTQDLGAEKVV